MSCEFKPGDEVVCVTTVALLDRPFIPPIVAGRVYTVEAVRMSVTTPGVVVVELAGMAWTTRQGLRGGWRPHRFRKVQKRDLTAWIGQTTTFEEPKRVRSPA